MAASVARNPMHQGYERLTELGSSIYVVQNGPQKLSPTTETEPLSQSPPRQQPSMETSTSDVEIPAVAGSLAMDTTIAAVDPAAPVAAMKANANKSASSKKKASAKKRKALGPPAAPCVGLYVDALDAKMLWAEAQIIDCKLEEQKIKVHFIGWKARWDIWTDAMSIAGHGTYVPLTKKSLAQSRRWDGQTDLFSENPIELDNGDHAVVPLVEEEQSSRPVTPRAKPEKAASKPPTANQASGSLPAVTRKPRPVKVVVENTVKETPVETKTFPGKNGRVAVVKPSPTRKASASPAPRTLPTASTTTTTTATPEATTGKKRGKSSGVSPTAANDAKRLKAIAEFLPVDAALDLAVIRKLNTEEEKQTATFLQRCADVWKRQLSGLSKRQS